MGKSSVATGWAALMALALTACGPGATTKFEKEGAGRSAHHGQTAVSEKPSREPYEGCTWQQIQVRDVQMWSQVCAKVQLSVGKDSTAEQSLDALRLSETNEQGALVQGTSTVVLFPTDAGGLESLTKLVMAHGRAPAGATCGLEPIANGPAGRKRYVLTPTGAWKASWDQAVATDTMSEDPPCGTFGVWVIGDRYIEIQDARPDTAIFVELGSEQGIYDAETIAFVSKDSAPHSEGEH